METRREKNRLVSATAAVRLFTPDAGPASPRSAEPCARGPPAPSPGISMNHNGHLDASLGQTPE